MPNSTVLIGAHNAAADQTGTDPATLDAYEVATRLKVDFVHVEVHRCSDGTFVASPSETIGEGPTATALAARTAGAIEMVTGRRLARLTDILAMLRDSGRKAHLELKFYSHDDLYIGLDDSYEVHALREAASVMPAGWLIVTSANDLAVKAMARWTVTNMVDVQVGLVLGHDPGGPIWKRLASKRRDVFPEKRVKATHANLIVAPAPLASLRLADWAVSSKVPLVVTGVNEKKALTKMLSDARIWMVTTTSPNLIPRHRADAKAPLGRKILIGLVLVVLIALVAFVGWTLLNLYLFQTGQEPLTGSIGATPPTSANNLPGLVATS